MGNRLPISAADGLEQSKELEELRRVVRELTLLIGGEELAEMRRDFAAWLRRVLLPTNFSGAMIPETGDLREIDEMLAETVKAWPEQWLARGRREGRREGQLEGSRRLLTSLIEEKFGSFPAEYRVLVEAATEDQVARWARRTLTAPSIEALFRD